MDRDWIWHWPQAIIPTIMITVFCILALSVFFGPSPGRQPPGSTIYMRGCVMVVVRFNTRSIPQAMNICDDGRVARIANPPNRSLYSSPILLTADEQQEVLALRSQWCGHPLPVTAVADVAATEDVGILCTTSTEVTQFRLAPTELPSILTRIDQRLPPLR